MQSSLDTCFNSTFSNNKLTSMAEQKSDSPSIKIIYYAFSGRGGPLRLAAFYGGVSFEDEFITFEQQTKDKAEGRRRWSGPPEIIIYDKNGKEIATIAQSNACLRYIGMLLTTLFIIIRSCIQTYVLPSFHIYTYILYINNHSSQTQDKLVVYIQKIQLNVHYVMKY